jgi:hypothetical protein
MPKIKQYNIAMQELQKEEQPEAQSNDNAKSVIDAAEQLASVQLDDKADSYKEKINKSAKDKARKKASSVKGQKPVRRRSSKKVDAMKLEGEDFMDYWKKLERAGIK